MCLAIWFSGFKSLTGRANSWSVDLAITSHSEVQTLRSSPSRLGCFLGEISRCGGLHGEGRDYSSFLIRVISRVTSL